MKAILITYDSLNRRLLPNYGCESVHAPEFEELGRRCTRFDACYAGSLPCMPARREMHTGRENFLHARWSALEPFDDSMPEILGRNGVYTHLTTDHVHYWEDAGFGYHTRYRSFQFSRGQEGDPVYGQVGRGALETAMRGRRVPHLRVQDAINRAHMKDAAAFPQAVTFQQGLDFLAENHSEDQWFLHIETFDPHEPFFAPPAFRRLYGLEEPADQRHDWPDYLAVPDDMPPEKIERYRLENKALVSFCSYNLGRVMQAMDAYGLWDDTLLIVHTDHGFMLGEHGWLGKNTGPYYDEVAHLPLFIHDPRDSNPAAASDDLVQTVDIPATILDFFGLPLPGHMTGRPIRQGRRAEKRDLAVWGIFGGQLNATDGRHILMLPPDASVPLYCYTLAGLHFARHRIQAGNAPYEITLSGGFGFTKGHPLLRVGNMHNDFQTQQPQCGRLLFDMEADSAQARSISDPAVLERMRRQLIRKLDGLEAPPEAYARFCLNDPAKFSALESAAEAEKTE